MRCVTLMTDFGIKDGNIGVMKGVIWKIAPGALVADLTHMIQPQNVVEGAFVLGRSAYYFPDETIHVCVVDPGVGTQRRPIAARLGSQYFVGPDNGLCTVMLEKCEKAGWPVKFVHLNKPEYWLEKVSHVFHGRDIFSPSAAHLARGVPLEELGSVITDPVRLNLPRPVYQDGVWHGQVVHIDHFGNLASNITVEDLENLGNDVLVRLGDLELPGLVNTFGEREPGELIALFGSTGNLIISLVNGSAAARLHTAVGDEITAQPLP